MDSSRAFLAIGLSFIILLAYQYFFIDPPVDARQGRLALELAHRVRAAIEDG